MMLCVSGRVGMAAKRWKRPYVTFCRRLCTGTFSASPAHDAFKVCGESGFQPMTTLLLDSSDIVSVMSVPIKQAT